MATTLSDFTTIRNRILKNAIYNSILTAVLCEKVTFCVAFTLQNTLEETKSELAKDVNRKRFPKYLLYELMVEYKKGYFSIGLKYKDHPIIWEYPKVKPSSLRQLTEFIYAKYPVNSAKADKIFSEIPYDARLFLEDNMLSENFWRLGFAKKIKNKEHKELDMNQIDDYYKKLTYRNREYQVFNKILIDIMKNNVYSVQNVFGYIKIRNVKARYKNKLVVEFYSESDLKTYTDILPINIFSPTLWNSVDSHLDKNVLVLFNS